MTTEQTVSQATETATLNPAMESTVTTEIVTAVAPAPLPPKVKLPRDVAKYVELFGGDAPTMLDASMQARVVIELGRRERLQGFFSALAGMKEFIKATGTGPLVQVVANGRTTLGEVVDVDCHRGRYGFTSVGVRDFSGMVEQFNWKTTGLESMTLMGVSGLQETIKATVGKTVVAEIKELANLRKRGAKRSDDDNARMAALQAIYASE